MDRLLQILGPSNVLASSEERHSSSSVCPQISLFEYRLVTIIYSDLVNIYFTTANPVVLVDEGPFDVTIIFKF